MRSTVQRHTVLGEYAEHGTSAGEAADGKDVIYAVPVSYTHLDVYKRQMYYQ